MNECFQETTSSYAPIVLFVFNRPDCTAKTLAALACNDLAKDSDLFVYADAPRSENDMESVCEVREIVDSAVGFRSVTVVEREANIGLAKNIIDGVSEVCERYGKVIVLEDDILTNPGFLRFMNAALVRYIQDPKVWHISGWNYPLDPVGLAPVYFWRVMNCWGWATWNDRWRLFEKNPAAILNTWDIRRRRKFDINGAVPFFSQIIANYLGERSTWAIFWYATIFERAGLCLTPACSLTRNIGGDGTGTHAGGPDIFFEHDWQQNDEWYLDSGNGTLIFPEDIQESHEAILSLRNLYRDINGVSDKIKIIVYAYIPTRWWVALKKVAQFVRMFVTRT